jgi:hypothetical protein
MASKNGHNAHHSNAHFLTPKKKNGPIPPTPEEEEEEEESRKGGNRPDTPRAGHWSLVEGSLVFGEYAFPPVSLGPAGDCPCKD